MRASLSAESRGKSRVALRRLPRRRNKAPLKVKYDERCDICHRIRRKAAGDDRIRATFRTGGRPTCTVCQTPIDYRIRPSNASSFHEPRRRPAPLRCSRRRAPRATRRRKRSASPCSEEEGGRAEVAIPRSARAGGVQRTSSRTNALAMFSSSVTSTDDETLDSMNATLNTDTERAAGSVRRGQAAERSSRTSARVRRARTIVMMPPLMSEG